MNKITLLVAITILLVGCAPDDQPATETNDAPIVDAADTVYTNGKIYTVNEAQPWAEAVAITDGKFTAVGSAADVKVLIGNGTEVIDLKGGFAMPGIHDTHVHPPLVYTF